LWSSPVSNRTQPANRNARATRCRRTITGQRHVAITDHRTRKDWAHFIKGMLDERYSQATKVRLVMDNLNTQDARIKLKRLYPNL
jgi:hypothetical protein